MLKRHFMLAMVGAALIATPALAQSSPPAPAAPAPAATVTKNETVHSNGMWRASKLMGVDVYNNANEKIGDISEVILDSNGKVANVVIGVGGFLGMGQHDVAVAFDKLKFVNEPVKSTTASTTTTTTNTTTGASTTRTTSTEKNWYPDHAVFDASKDQLKAMPEFKF